MTRTARAFALVVGLPALGFGGLALYDAAAPAPVPWIAAAGLQARFATVEGRRLRYVRAGSGPAVVLVHGFGSSLYTWKDVIPGLARDRDVVALDLPGFGLSDQPADLSVDDLPRAVLGLMDRLGIERAALVGNSLGGATAVLVAAEQPGRVLALVLVDPAGFNLDPADQPRMVGMLMSGAGALVRSLPGKRLVVETALREVFHDETKLTPERIAEYLQGATRPGTFASIRSLGRSLRGRTTLVRDALSRVQAPTLVLWGREDRWIPLVHAERFRSAVPGARLEVIDACGHVPQEEKPEVVVRLLRDFLARLPGEATAGRG